MDIVEAMVVDAQVCGAVSRASALDAVEEWLTETAPERETWGTTPAAVEGQRAMMALAGGPAPPRTQERPEPNVSEAEPPGGDGPG